jgi:hypothetical protein
MDIVVIQEELAAPTGPENTSLKRQDKSLALGDAGLHVGHSLRIPPIPASCFLGEIRPLITLM